MFVGLSSFDNVYILDRLPMENEKARALRYFNCAGGPSLNAAITFAILAGSGVLFSPLGRNLFSDFIFQECDRFGVRLVDVAMRSDYQTTVASIALSDNGRSRTIWSFSSRPEIDVVAVLAGLDQRPSFLHLDGYYLDNILPVVARAKEMSVPLVLDGGSWKPGTEKLLPECAIVIASEKFVPPNIEKERDVLDYLKALGIRMAAITRGDKSIIGFDAHTSFEIETPRISPVDTLGAGDVFHGAFNWAYFTIQQTFKTALSTAADVAALSCMHYGPRIGVQEYAKRLFNKNVGPSA